MELEDILAQNKRLGNSAKNKDLDKTRPKRFISHLLAGIGKAILVGSAIGSAMFLYQNRQQIESCLVKYTSTSQSCTLSAAASPEGYEQARILEKPKDTSADGKADTRKAKKSEGPLEIDKCYIRMDPKDPNPMLERLCSEVYKGEMICKVDSGADNNPYYVLKMIPRYYEMIMQEDDESLKAELGLDSTRLPRIISDTISFEMQKLRKTQEQNQSLGFQLMPYEITIEKVHDLDEISMEQDTGIKLEYLYD